MDTKRKLIDGCFLSTQVKDPDLGVRDSSAETRLGVWLVLAVTITSRRSSSHFDNNSIDQIQSLANKKDDGITLQDALSKRRRDWNRKPRVSGTVSSVRSVDVCLVLPSVVLEGEEHV